MGNSREVLLKTEQKVSNDSATPYLGIDLEVTRILKDNCSLMITTALTERDRMDKTVD